MRVKVIIKNDTRWQTKMLRPFITRIAREEFPGTKPTNTRRRVIVNIIYNRGNGDGYCSGYAYLNSSQATVRVPNDQHGNRFPVLDFCHVVGHEFGHCKGLQHSEMGLHYGNSCKRGSYSNPHYEWAKALPVPLPVPKKKAPTTDQKRETALQAAHAAVERWTRKRKLADTKLKVWTRKVKTLEKRIASSRAACLPPPVEPPS